LHSVDNEAKKKFPFDEETFSTLPDKEESSLKSILSTKKVCENYQTTTKERGIFPTRKPLQVEAIPYLDQPKKKGIS
jgi:hypothetical protein